MAAIRPLASPQQKYRFLDPAQREQLHEATLSVLEQAGVKFPSTKALEILAQAGARVDFQTQIVRFPPEMLLKALSTAPRSHTLSSRGSAELDLRLDGRHIYIGGEGTGHTMIDLENGQRRASVKRDIELLARIMDALPNACFYEPNVSAGDVPKETIALHEIEAAFNNTEKHVNVISCVEEQAAVHAVRMAEVVAGGREALRRRPPLSLLVCTVAPLGQDKGVLEASLVFAAAGLPVCYLAMPTMCSTTPGSAASNLVIGNAEVLSAIALIQLAHPGAPVLHAIEPELLNPLTGGVYTPALQKPLLYGCCIDLGHSYNLPVLAYYGGSDSVELDHWITGKDNAIDALLVSQAGPELIQSMGGLLEGYTVCHPEKILFDNDIVNSIHEVLDGIAVNKDTIMLDEILAVGPGGHFLNRESTKLNMRRLWNRGVFTRWSAERKGFLPPQQAAMEEVRRILKTHQPNPLEPRVREELAGIIRSAESSLRP